MATPILIRSICCIFVQCMIEDASMEAQEALVEALTHVDVDELEAVIQTMQNDKQSRFLPVLDNSIERLRRLISSAAETRAPLTSTTIRTTSLMLNFLALCCNASSCLSCGVSVSALLSTVIIYTSRLHTSCLSCHVLTAVSSFEGSRRNNPSNKSIKIPWEIALSYPRSDILMASCLASCILALEHTESLHTSTVAEIWDYLRDVLFLTFTGYFIGDETPLSILVAPTLCEALLALLRHTGGPFGNSLFTPCRRR
ncbi:hypothetical protein BC827DRAFT_302021 [Russula dissimulans]|nr:hypothetical protein BC827DRAFT_302021 [Russula dissimulans]